MSAGAFEAASHVRIGQDRLHGIGQALASNFAQLLLAGSDLRCHSRSEVYFCRKDIVHPSKVCGVSMMGWMEVLMNHDSSFHDHEIEIMSIIPKVNKEPTP